MYPRPCSESSNSGVSLGRVLGTFFGFEAEAVGFNWKLLLLPLPPLLNFEKLLEDFGKEEVELTLGLELGLGAGSG